MYACVALTRHVLAGSVPPPALMAALILAGIVGYAATTLATNQDGVREVLNLFRRQPAGDKQA
jgi:hypothetical protein